MQPVAARRRLVYQARELRLIHFGGRDVVPTSATPKLPKPGIFKLSRRQSKRLPRPHPETGRILITARYLFNVLYDTAFLLQRNITS